MKYFWFLALSFWSFGSLGCGQESATASLRALDVSGDLTLVCLTRDETGAFTRGVDRALCPDYSSSSTNPDQRRLFALVTQPLNGEVAAVDLAESPNNAVVDFEPTQPGYSFMPVGSEPSAIVSTPGSVASFVAVREAGREGIFGLPSSCIAPRPASAPLRDIRTWPACRLPAAPGPMIVLDDPVLDHDADPGTPGLVRESCDADYVDASALVSPAPGAGREQCPADLSSEGGLAGRRKLLVSLPSLSELWLIDAQELLDRPAGSFDACTFERRFPLEAAPTGQPQRLPADLVASSASCEPVGLNHGPRPDVFRPWPADLALDDEGRLFIADSSAPVVHVLDVGDPCAAAALPSLEPVSFSDPNALITTRRVAVSPLTPLGKRFVYAVDNSDTPTAGSLMVFDVSPGSTELTPLVRERAAFTPSEPPDRILLSRDVSDVEFVFQDFPEPQSDIAVEGVACDPHPNAPPDGASARYRPSPDLSSGATPLKLRGTFAFAALHSGQITVIDVEDLDRACRRPVSVNPGAEENILGCRNDDPSVTPDYRLSNNSPTVSNELSCNVVVPHRARSRSFFTNAGGSISAGLLAFPTLTLDTGRSVTTDQSEEGRDQPKMLGARFSDAQSGQVFIGPVRYDTAEQTGNRLELDPARADRSSLLLSYEEPRAFTPLEDFTATYEGVVRDISEALLSVDAATGLGVINEGLNAAFCSAGVHDADVTRDVAGTLGVEASADQISFARLHADYVQIMDELLEQEDPYWRGAGAQCGSQLFGGGEDASASGAGRTLCEQFFGTPEVPTFNRDWRIVEASQDRLLVEPRDPRSYDPNINTELRRRQLAEFSACCFPQPALFQIRGGNQWIVRGSATGFQHRVTTDPVSGRCVANCSPLVQKLEGRTFEISCSAGNCPTDAQGRPAVGVADPEQDFACVIDEASAFQEGIDPGEPGSECVFQNLTTRFAIYRGQTASTRDMRFRWQFSDGFAPLSIPLTSADRPLSVPRSLVLVPETNQLVVSDGNARGLTFVAPRNPGTILSIF
jgi:hypothetical protein